MDSLCLFVWDSEMSVKIPAYVLPATSTDFLSTKDWQTNWTSVDAESLPNKVALHRSDNEELLGLMSYEKQESALAVEIIYIESAGHSNANLLHITGEKKKYIGIARALIAYAAKVSVDAGYDGVLIFKAKTDELRDYYMKEFGALPVGRYDPYRMAIWEDAAAEILAGYKEGEE